MSRLREQRVVTLAQPVWVSGTVFVHLRPAFCVERCPQKFHLESVLEEEHSENHFVFIESFIPSQNKYVLSD